MNLHVTRFSPPPVFYPSVIPFPFFFFSPLLYLSTDCQFEIGGWDGIIRSSQVEEEERVKPGDALDCIWTIRAPPQSKVSTRDHISHSILSFNAWLVLSEIFLLKWLQFRVWSMLLFGWLQFKAILKYLTNAGFNLLKAVMI